MGGRGEKAGNGRMEVPKLFSSRLPVKFLHSVINSRGRHCLVVRSHVTIAKEAKKAFCGHGILTKTR